MLCEIPLTQNKIALVDRKNFAWLIQYKWCARKDKYRDRWIAVARIGKKQIKMHRLIMHAGEGGEVDHADHDGLHNYESNLRLSDKSQNQANQVIRIDNTSGYKGVCPSPNGKRWKAQIKVRGKQIYLGTFDDIVDAAVTYDTVAEREFGVFALTNKSLGLIL